MINHTTELKWNADKDITKSEIRDWLTDSQIPGAAKITFVTGTYGSQRDPYTKVTAMRASWTT